MALDFRREKEVVNGRYVGECFLTSPAGMVATIGSIPASRRDWINRLT